MSDAPIQQVAMQTACRICGGLMTVYADPPECPGSAYEQDWRERLRKVVAHDVCVDKKLSAERAERMATELIRRTEKWRSMCPDEFQKPLDWSKRGCKRNQYEAVMAWKFNGRGLLIHGPSRRCKTRFAWKLLEREAQLGKKVAAVSHAEARMRFSMLAREDMGQLDRYVTTLSGADVLLIDDLGKGYSTEASESALFVLVDTRVHYGRPIIVTTNDTLDILLTRFSEERGRAMLRRIQDYCEALEFR